MFRISASISSIVSIMSLDRKLRGQPQRLKSDAIEMAKSWRNHHHMQSWRDWPTLSFNHHLMVALYFIHDVSSCVQMATPFFGVDKRMEICLPFGGGYFPHFAKVLQIHRGFTESRCTEACDMRNGHGI